ncbi:MAG TPA: GTPase ObgE [Prevotellaceae bacterium]|nr:GTPase ObgE [Prevotellaceae bacterium]
MAESNFVDYVKICCRSGKGGRGSAHMHRAKYIPNGGPDGGDGGRGGNVYLRANHNYWTLLHLRYERHIFAGHGGNGGQNRSTGAKGEDRYIDVPCGTVAYNAETGEYLCDVTEDGQVVTLLKGGRGGLGNWNFRTSTNQAPRFAQPGEPMREMTVVLELKLLADVGLVGFPNAGKSTLLSALSSARPKIANYPFTTMEPSLGIVPYRDNQSFVMADIPGIIEGAAEGRGLGLRFLRHIERNSLLLFMVPGDTDSISKEYEILLREVSTFNPELLDKQRVLAITKCDLLDQELMDMLAEELPQDIPHVFISAVAGLGMQELKDVLWRELNSESNKLQAIAQGETLVHRNKDPEWLKSEMQDEGEDEEIEVLDGDGLVEDIDDLEDYEYEDE